MAFGSTQPPSSPSQKRHYNNIKPPVNIETVQPIFAIYCSLLEMNFLEWQRGESYLHWGCIEWDSKEWDSLSLIGSTREILEIRIEWDK